MAYKNIIAAAALVIATPAFSDEPVRIGLIAPLTGQFGQAGLEMRAGAELYMKQHGAKVAGRTVDLVLKDDGAVADVTRRLATELVVNDKVSLLAGMVLTPLAMAAAQVATKSQVPLIVMGASTSTLPQSSPYFVRTSWNLADAYRVLVKWAVEKQNVKNVVTLVADYAPGYDVEKVVSEAITAAGGKIVDALRAPVMSPDYSALIQRAVDAKPDALVIFVPSTSAPTLLRQLAERGVDKTPIKVLATGDVLDEQALDSSGRAAEGLVSAYHYSDAHESQINRSFVKDIQEKYNIRPNMMALGAYDGMHVIYKALETTNGSTDVNKLIAAMKGMSWESPAGQARINAATRDVERTLYLRRVERRNGQLANVEFETYPLGAER